MPPHDVCSWPIWETMVSQKGEIFPVAASLRLPCLLIGLERRGVAQQFCRSDRVIRLWIEMFNRGGIDALTTKGHPGRRRRVKLERLRDLLVPVLENPRQAGELHWTGVKIHGFLKKQLGLDVGYSTTVRYLHLRVPRPEVSEVLCLGPVYFSSFGSDFARAR
jgi:transposase